ncbi:MAG: hypothetical protein WC096_09150, partial [Sphaerochaetaceae bacterium]
MKAIHLALLILVGLLTITPAASAATGTGTLYVTNASDVERGSTATVSIYLKNNFEPKIGAYEILMYFDNEVVKPKEIQPFNATDVNPFYEDKCSYIGGYLKDGYDNGDLLLATVTLESQTDDGRSSELRMEVDKLVTVIVGSKTEPLTVSIQNGIFTTEDKVLPVITLDTKGRVPSTFDVAGTIHEAGEIKSAQATLKNSTHAAVVYDLLPLGGSAPDYTFNR